MGWNSMDISMRTIYLFEFKKYFLNDLYFYWQLSTDNPLISKLEKSFGFNIKSFSAITANRAMTLAEVERIQLIYRQVLGIVFHSTVDKYKSIVNFEKFLLGD